ncbi:MAG: helix-turn-helix domain-containing protein [Pyrinomonadaceae bacterium]
MRKKAAFTLWMNGYSYTEISSFFNVHPTTVGRWLRDYW